MLTADLVRARRLGGELRITRLDDKARARALDLAEALVGIAGQHVGKTRDELDEALAQVECAPRDCLLLDGLRKLVEDRCDFDMPADVAPDELRSEVFEKAAAARRETLFFNRQDILAAVAAGRNLSVEQLERGMYADLRGAQLLMSLQPVSAQGLVDSFDTAQAQAVLLRAVRVTARVRCASAWAYRALFHKLKFLRLLVTITPIAQDEEEGYCLDIDGPFSLFESVTKYGLQLALALPAIMACQHYRIEADIRWGKERQPLLFHLEGEGAEADLAPGEDPPLSEEVAAFVRGFRALDTPWQLTLSPAILHIPGAGVCVPDLVFHKPGDKPQARKKAAPDTGPRVYLEVMGFWSRDAVFRRVELVQKGLSDPILFVLSERLRVSEQVLPAGLPAALYVYKGIISPKVVAQRLDQLCAASYQQTSP